MFQGNIQGARVEFGSFSEEVQTVNGSIEVTLTGYMGHLLTITQMYRNMVNADSFLKISLEIYACIPLSSKIMLFLKLFSVVSFLHLTVQLIFFF